MTTFALIINQKSGKREKDQLIETIKNFLIEKNIPEKNILYFYPASADETREMAKEACLDKIDVIIPLGGDGTIKLVCAGIYEGGGYSRLGLIPTGTVNNLAKSLNIPLNPKKALENLFSGRELAIDIARVNDQYMISSLTLGLMADMALSVTPEHKRRYGALAFIKAGWKIFLRRRSYRVQAISDQKKQYFKTKLLLITMSNTVAGLPGFNQKDTVDDGLFTVYTLRKTHFIRFFFYFFFRIGKFNHFRHWDSFQASELRLINVRKKDKNNPNVRIDGDVAGKLPVLIQMLPKAITVIVPKK
ncbi:diacylglycerol kinase family protein [Streptococcus thoraltensis]|uniref:diacylglycerol/lipid kinase family protein n=1 Tax=Streptococcus thoraltensis TaxID=55085 RepID=UPI000364713D|nr:diacylglycerol kinase family protein [Streptococcus thoraltensis]MDY4761460.1 diacylglycerol kinase family lipid kinase [Streptococcus thoraltensis]